MNVVELRRYPVRSMLGEVVPAADPDGHRAVSEILGRPVTLAPEASVPYHDEGPVSKITTASLRRLGELVGGDRIDALRFRANVLVDVPGTGFAEDTWSGRRLRPRTASGPARAGPIARFRGWRAVPISLSR